MPNHRLAGRTERPLHRRWPILLVVPCAVMDNWADELAQWGTFHHLVWRGKSAEATCAAAAAGRVEVVTVTHDYFRSGLAHAAGADCLPASSVRVADLVYTSTTDRHAQCCKPARWQSTHHREAKLLTCRLRRRLGSLDHIKPWYLGLDTISLEALTAGFRRLGSFT